MKTRRRVIKTPAKGRRSSIICVKKSPIARRNPRRNLRNQVRNSKMGTYESPLKHLQHNSPSHAPSTSSSISPVKTEPVKEENVEEEKEEKEKLNSVVEKLPTSKISVIKFEKMKIQDIDNTEKIEEENSDNMDEDFTETIPLRNRKKRSILSIIGAGEIPKPRKKKLKKSPLSRINESNELNKHSDSIFIVDDSEFKSVINPNQFSDSINDDLFAEPLESTSDNNPVQSSEFPELITNTEPDDSKPAQSSVLRTPEINNEEVVVIDCNDSSLIEMEAYHDAFKSDDNSPIISAKFTDSIIVIDPDDEQPVIPKNSTPKSINEDCFVVWSSLPKPCTSNDLPNVTDQPTFTRNPLFNNNVDILKCDKILIDTNAEPENLRYLNNENNNPSKRKLTKSPKMAKGLKKPFLKGPSDKIKATKTAVSTVTKATAKATTKAVTKATTKVAAKAATKVTAKAATKVTAKATTKSVTKTIATTKAAATTTLRKKAKNNGELIFLSESKEENKTLAQKRKAVKGKLREIVIDGSNVGMAYNNSKFFSEKGIKMLIDYFTKRGHTVKVFIPQYRRSRNFPLLEKWHTEGIAVFTPSRKLGTKSFTPYDDRYILEYATACEGIVVSQDQFRDLYAEKPQYRDTIENRLLVPTFVGDYVMFPEDPLGRDGPKLADFLRH